MNLTNDAVIAVIVLVLTASGLGYGLYERQAKLRAQAEIATVKAQEQVLADQAAVQNKNVEEMRAKAEAAAAAAAAAKKAADKANESLLAEHFRLQALINQPATSQSCDSAWDSIENRGVAAP